MLYSCTHRATLGVPAPSQLEHTDCDCCIIPEPTGLSVTLMPVRRHTLHACPAPALPPWLTTYHKQGYNYLTNSRITIPTKLKLYNTCILPIFPYGSECWAVTKRDVLKIDALDQWCLRKLLGIKWCHQCGMTRWDGQEGNHACWLLSKHGVFLCSAILQECQMRQMPGVS